MRELIWASAIEQAAAVRNRAISAVELVQFHLDHIERVNPSINAIVQIDDQRALVRAAEIDDVLKRGENPGPLAGVPFTAKDIIDTAGIITAAGVPERRDAIPRTDATTVYRMKAAGAILLGKTNCPPWGGGLESDNPVYGRTNNPYDLERTPGGSSGGEAAAISSGMSPIGIGSDSGGSLRYPAHFCGIATIKPTAGRVPLTGAFDDMGQFGGLRDPRTQIGPMARSVADVELMLGLIGGPDYLDASVHPYPVPEDVPDSLSGLRIALQTGGGEVETITETVRVVERAASALAQLGGDVVLADLPDEGMSLVREIWSSYGDDVSARELYRVLADWDAYRSTATAWFQRFDLIVRPVNATPAPLHGQTDPATLCTVPFSMTGWPAATVRCGATPEGLPIGVQVVAHPWRDRLALQVARALEAVTGGWQPPPRFVS